MYYSKTKRQLSFEQLDNRIAMNGDMHSSHTSAPGQLGAVDFVVHFESRNASFARIAEQRIVLQNIVVQNIIALHPVNPPPPRQFEAILFRNNIGMKSRAEGESVSLPIANIPAQASDQFGTESANSSAAVVRSNPNVVSTSSSSVVSSQDPPQNGLVIPSTTREIVPSASTTRGAIAAPPVDSSTNRVGTAVGLLNPQSSVLQSQVHEARPCMAATLVQSFQTNLIIAASKPETTKSIENGMFTFSLRQNADRSIALNSRNEYRALRDYPNTDTRTLKNHLPAPKGMIEIGDTLEGHSKRLQQSIVSMASNNPFEILQLFIGSTNMVSNASRTIGHIAEPDESTELSTKEDSILSLAIGVVLVIAGRQCKLLRTAERPPSVRITRKIGRPQPLT